MFYPIFLKKRKSLRKIKNTNGRGDYMLNWIINLFKGKKQESRYGENYTEEEDHQILNKPIDMTYVELAKKMRRTVKSVRQRKYYLSIKQKRS